MYIHRLFSGKIENEADCCTEEKVRTSTATNNEQLFSNDTEEKVRTSTATNNEQFFSNDTEEKVRTSTATNNEQLFSDDNTAV